MQPMQVSRFTDSTFRSGAAGLGSGASVMQSGTGQTATQYSQPRPKHFPGSTMASIFGSRLRTLLVCGCGTGSFSLSFGSLPTSGDAGIDPPGGSIACGPEV